MQFLRNLLQVFQYSFSLHFGRDFRALDGRTPKLPSRMNRAFPCFDVLIHRYGTCVAAMILLASVGVPYAVHAQQDSARAADAQSLLREGEYQQARPLFREQLDASSAGAPAPVRGYVATYLGIGAYEQGLQVISMLLEEYPQNPYLLFGKGQLHEALGQHASALSAYTSSLDHAPDFWPNVLALSELYRATGQRSEARQLQIRIYRAYREGRFRSADNLTIAGRAGAALQQFHEANSAYREAAKINRSHIQTLYWWAELFREKYNTADARRTYEDVLAVNPRHAASYVGLAKTTDSFSQKEKLARQALEINPNSVDAHNILGELRILDGQYEEARSILRDALDINPSATSTLGHLASIHYLNGDSAAFETTEQRALDINPRNGTFYLTIVDDIVRRFRYPAAVTFARRAVKIAPDNWQAYATLGTSLLRMGNAEEARQYLEISYDRDPFNLFAANTLTLLDERQQFSVQESEHFRLLVHPTEKDALGPLILRWAETAYDSLSTRYPYRPASKITLEAYNDADDFAVRVAGVPHIGLLGVAFGDVVALTTPGGRPDESFNWTRTLWHEIAHTMAIGISQHQVPRWFTEGLSVYEERRARPRWDREMKLRMFAAYDRGQLLPLEEIDKGFTRPQFPGQIVLTYYHASKVIELIVDHHGFQAVIDILATLRQGYPIDEAIERSLDRTIDALDQEFRARLDHERAEFAEALQDFPDVPQNRPAQASWLRQFDTEDQNPFLAKLRKGYHALEEENYDQAETVFQQSLDIYPYYIGDRNPYHGLAQLYRTQNNEQELINILERFLSISEFGASEARELAGLYRARGDTEEAIRYLNRTLETAPYHRETRRTLANLYRSTDRYDAAVTERRAVLNLDPVNEAEAYYQLAVDLYMSERVAEAKDAVVRALEIAPGYTEAQGLLLKCVSATNSER
jgi:tetratricopeptide (TPR) repeat protein